MKNYIIATFLIFTIFLSGCDKWPTNGNLDGMWQLVEIHTDKGKNDVRSEKRYCSFQLRLFCLGDNLITQRIFGYFEHNGNTIRFHTFTFRSAYTEDNNIDKLLTDDDIATIKPWGFNSTDCVLDIVELSNNTMILATNDTILTYRKK